MTNMNVMAGIVISGGIQGTINIGRRILRARERTNEMTNIWGH